MMFVRRTLIASAAFVMLAASPALAVDYGRWFFSTANDPKPPAFSTCVTRVQAAMATQGFGAHVGGTNPAYLDATTGLVSVTAFCIGQPKGFYYILVVMSDDGSKSALSVGNAINAVFFGSDASAAGGGSAATAARRPAAAGKP